MPSESITGTVLELQRKGILLVEDGNHGENRPRPHEFVDSGTVFIRAADMSGGRVQFETASRITSVARRRIVKGIGAPGDVLITSKGTVGKVAFVPTNAPPFVCSPQTTFWRTLNTELLDRGFLYCLMRSDQFQRQFMARAGETDMAPYASLTSQRSILLELPPISAQREVANTICALDDKIALLRETNATLEAVAQAIFKSWFVDFDPVRAKAEGRDPEGVPPEVADLFPSEFEESELGAIPKGWRVVRIGELLELTYGKALKATDRTPGEAPVYGSGGINGTHNRALVDRPTVIVGRKGTVGSLYWEDRPCFPIDTVFFVNPTLASLEFCFRALQNQPLREMNTDAAVPGLNRENVYRLKICLPPQSILGIFDDITGSLRKRMQATRDEIEGLTDLRDTLLPRLMSGKLRIER